MGARLINRVPDYFITRIGDASGPLVTYAWDAAQAGKLAGFTDPSGSTAYRYDTNGRLVARTQTVGGLGFSLDYAWNPAGQLAQLTTPSGNRIGYAYAHGKINAITVNGQPLLADIAHAPFGPIPGWTWSNGLTHLRAHGLDGEIRRIESAVVQDFDYDPAGRIVGQHLWSQTDPFQNDTLSSFSLDPAGRLTKAQTEVAQPQGVVGDSLDYAYDPNGNRQSLAWNAAATHYGYSGNRLAWSSGADNRTYAYDAAGRITGDGYYTYRYTPFGRLAAVNNGGRRIGEYAYNALGQRVSKTGLRFVYDESGHLLGEYDPRGNLVQELVWLDDLPVASLRPDARGGRTVEVFHIHPDHLGTPRQITDSADRIVWRWDSPDPFGNAPADDNPDDGKGKKSLFEFNLRFPGQYFDGETGLHYNYFRDYEPGTGRYVQTDPIGLRGGINLYAYVDGNPISKIDPLGLAGATGTWSAGASGSWNGNTSPGYTEQDWVCSAPAGIFNSFACTKQCCVEHDECYKKNLCNQSSWGGPLSSACQQCNITAVHCIASGSPRGGCGQGCSSTFNGAP